MRPGIVERLIAINLRLLEDPLIGRGPLGDVRVDGQTQVEGLRDAVVVDARVDEDAALGVFFAVVDEAAVLMEWLVNSNNAPRF